MPRHGSAAFSPVVGPADGVSASPPKPPMQRSRVTNGKQLFVRAGNPNENTAWARRLKDLIGDHLVDLGGPDHCSAAELMLVRRAAMLVLQCEMLEQKWAARTDGEASERSLMIYQRTASALRRILETLGLQRRAKDVTPPTLKTYLANKYGDADAADTD